MVTKQNNSIKTLQETKLIKSIPNKIINDRKIRINLAKRDVLWFLRIYLSHYISYSIADFQIEILKLLQNQQNKLISIVAFRGSAKSTFCSLLLPIWSILGIPKKKHVVLVCQTQQKSQQVLYNIRQELEGSLLTNDFGSFNENVNQWNQYAIEIPKLGAIITAVSIGESIRGIRYKEHRPDLIICDDIEDVQSARVKESRDKLWQFVNGELLPTGDKNTRYIFIGNLVHEDSVMMKLINAIRENKLEGTYRKYPLINSDGNIAWPGKYPSKLEIEKLKRTVISESDYLREYCLTIIPEGDRIIYSEDIKRYVENELAPRTDFQFWIISVDPAVSEEHTADKTAIVIGKVYGSGDKFEIYLLPHPINKRMGFPEIINEIKRIIGSLGQCQNYKILVEGGSFQKGLAQELKYEELNAEEINPQGQDKRTRLSIARQWIQNRIFFPRKGTEELETQLYGFGVERYDDLVDALTLIVISMSEIKPSNNPVFVEYDRFKNISREINPENDDSDDFLRKISKGKWKNILPG